MLPTARPQSPARVRVGWLPFAGISLPGAEALRLLAMDYERDALVPAPDMPSAPAGSRGPIHPSHPAVMPPNSQPSYYLPPSQLAHPRSQRSPATATSQKAAG